jgi:hypothetical protein
VLTRHWGKLLLVAGGLMVVAIILVLALVVPQWPFREGELKKRIETEMNGTVQFGHYRQVFLPHPGAVIDLMTLTPRDPSRPKITAQRVTIRGLYWGLFVTPKHLKAMSFDGLEISFPPKDGKHNTQTQNGKDASKDDTRYDEVDAKDSRVVFAGADGAGPQTYEIYQLVMKNFSATGPMHFSSNLKIPTPVANVAVSGIFGPINHQKLGETPLSGKFTMKNANLATFRSLYGTLAGYGEFQGKLGELKVNGGTEMQNFGVTDTAHDLPLKTQFTVMVDGTSGNVEFEPIHATLGKTKLVAQGQLADSADKKKTLTLNISSNDARIEDLMYLFVHSKKPPLAGPTQFKMDVKLPSGDAPFEKRVEMKAHFGIEKSKFTHSDTEQKVSALSEAARGNPKDEDPPTVVSDLTGDLTLKGGTANFSRLDCDVPGASAKLHGKYNLESHAVDLHGMLQTDVKLSKATTGFKAFLMKVVEAAKKKKKEGATVPVKITGTYEKPDFGLDATAEK